MFPKIRNQMLWQQAGGGGPSGSQEKPPEKVEEKPPEKPQEKPPAPPALPPELASLGFKDANQVLQYLAEVGEDAKKSKTMFQELSQRIAGNQPTQDELTEDTFIKEPKRATELTVDKRLDAHFKQRIAPIAVQLAEGNVTAQLRELRDDPEFGSLLPDLSEELTTFLKGVPMEVKIQPGAVRKAMQLVVGQNFSKVAKKWNEGQARLAAGSAGGSNESSGGGGGGSANVVTQFSKLPEEEQKAARNQISRGMFKDEAEYMQWKNEDFEGGD